MSILSCRGALARPAPTHTINRHISQGRQQSEHLCCEVETANPCRYPKCKIAQMCAPAEPLAQTSDNAYSSAFDFSR